MKHIRLVKEFITSEKVGGLVLVFVTIVSLVLSNSQWQGDYTGFWNIKFEGHTLVHWINDGLMTIFFLFIGLELEREIYTGELSNIKKASLPIFAALGGMIIPFGLFFLLNIGTDYTSGAGIPMATDIAFAVGILSLLGRGVPLSLKIFLTAFAVIDDLGAIIIIAIFYNTGLSFLNLFIALGIFGFLLILNRFKVYSLIPYLMGGLLMWYFMLHSGVHATVTGVLLAFAIPFGDGGHKTPSFNLLHYLHKPVTLIILPLFALANTCIVFGNDWLAGIGQTYSIGIFAGLIIGKPLGIWLFSYLAVRSGLSVIPGDLKWNNIFGAGLLGGIGFTMSIFITLLAFDNIEIINSSKTAILIASTISGIAGYLWLKFTLKKA